MSMFQSLTFLYLPPSEGGVLKIEDLFDILEKLKPCSSKWFDLGLALELDYNSLKSIEDKYRGDPDTCLREMLATRLTSCETPLTLCKLCTCLRKSTVGREDLAEEIGRDGSGKLYVHVYMCFETLLVI